jgi:hypothetical protein
MIDHGRYTFGEEGRRKKEEGRKPFDFAQGTGRKPLLNRQDVCSTINMVDVYVY